jgi:hypothetical protein
MHKSSSGPPLFNSSNPFLLDILAFQKSRKNFLRAFRVSISMIFSIFFSRPNFQFFVRFSGFDFGFFFVVRFFPFFSYKNFGKNHSKTIVKMQFFSNFHWRPSAISLFQETKFNFFIFSLNLINFRPYLGRGINCPCRGNIFKLIHYLFNVNLLEKYN